ncbi:hypothetical protein SLEP1_g10707 [Rubroshorea leprosula]|uniref:Uncharacterized protein n=1 Tax=Rubroshorea leprosula TaxID=152421 RepID=A0AAV5IEU0_9ROSI|nr:hypothetical protein SLEP1_g10707 [Rubroshorea leprosula]
MPDDMSAVNSMHASSMGLLICCLLRNLFKPSISLKNVYIWF